jgi:hypothetical protein
LFIDERPQVVREQLQGIKTLQAQWNALTLSQRIAIAKLSPDLSLFFRPKSR